MKIGNKVFYFDKKGHGYKAIVLAVNNDSINLIYSSTDDIEKIITRTKQQTKIKLKDKKNKELVKEIKKGDENKKAKAKKLYKNCITVKNVIPKDKAKVVKFKPNSKGTDGKPIPWNAKINCYKLIKG